MRLRIAFIRYGNDQTLMPNVLVATDEYMEDAYGGVPAYFCDQLDEAEVGVDVVRECFVEVADDDVLALFEIPVVTAAVTIGDAGAPSVPTTEAGQ